MEDPNNKNVSRNLNVVQYFKLFRNYDIKYSKLPCLHVGNVNKKTAIPIEVNISYIYGCNKSTVKKQIVVSTFFKIV